jgi:hypothetical protein
LSAKALAAADRDDQVMKTLIANLEARIRPARNVRRAVSLLAFLAGTALAQGSPDCGKFATISTNIGPLCHRVGILPWFVGIPGVWETELRFGVGLDAIRFGYGLPSAYFTNLVAEDSERGLRAFEGISDLDLRKTHASYTSRILGFSDNALSKPRKATGSLGMTADGPRAAALEAVSAYAVYRYIVDGSVVAQTTAPVIFLDQATARWSAIVTDTPRDQQTQPGATITSFAVANLSPDPQSVLIEVYDEFGQLSASVKTRELESGAGGADSGDVYADTLSHVLGINLPVSACHNCTSAPVFRGTVVFQGEQGGPIAPVVFRFNGPAMTTVPVRAE